MPALRILAVACAIAVIFALLGYALSRDRRWLTLAGYALKIGLALAALLALFAALRRIFA